MEFKIFTLNCWGLPVVSKYRSDRMYHIAEYLGTHHYDAVCLQEVWTLEDYNMIKERVVENLPYTHYFYSGITGSGICILSRYPIIDVFYHQWPLNGYMHKLHHGDWFAGKGVGMCRLKVNDLTINLYSAHLHAEYNRENDEYFAHRILQAFDTAQFIYLTSLGADATILAGDLNIEPDDLAYKLLLGVTGFNDAFIESGVTTSLLIATNENPKGSFTARHNIVNEIPGKRIDYVMYKSSSNVELDIKKYDLPLPNRIPDKNYSYSDHEAVLCTFTLEKDVLQNRKANIELEQGALEESIVVMDDAMNSLRNHKLLYWICAILLISLFNILLILQDSITNIVLSNILKICFLVTAVYSLIMATCWNSLERHSIIAAKMAMEKRLNNLRREIKKE